MMFFDSYVLIEIIKGNQKYNKYLNEILVITKLNLMELYYYLLREKGEEKADYYYEYYDPARVVFPDNSIKNAMRFKLKNKNRDLSYADCIGYILSLELGIKFLTGDKQFRNMANVEFVK